MTSNLNTSGSCKVRTMMSSHNVTHVNNTTSQSLDGEVLMNLDYSKLDYKGKRFVCITETSYLNFYLRFDKVVFLKVNYYGYKTDRIGL